MNPGGYVGAGGDAGGVNPGGCVGVDNDRSTAGGPDSHDNGSFVDAGDWPKSRSKPCWSYSLYAGRECTTSRNSHLSPLSDQMHRKYFTGGMGITIASRASA